MRLFRFRQLSLTKVKKNWYYAAFEHGTNASETLSRKGGVEGKRYHRMSEERSPGHAINMPLNPEYQSHQTNLSTRLPVEEPLLLYFVCSKMNPHNIFGLPQHNITASWEAPASHRGTYNILYSCCITLLLCVWKVIHPSIPQKRRHDQVEESANTPQSARQNAERWLFMIRDALLNSVRDLLRPGTLSHQVKWAVLAAFAPEMVSQNSGRVWS